MNAKRIMSYMTITTLCAVVCCVSAAYLLFENAIFWESAYAFLLRPLVSLLTGFVLLRHFVALYHLRLKAKSLLLKVIVILLFLVFLTVILYLYFALYNYCLANQLFWEKGPISYLVYFRSEICRVSEWAVPSVIYLTVSIIFIIMNETIIGQRLYREVIEPFYASPFIKETIDAIDETEEVEGNDDLALLTMIIDERIARVLQRAEGFEVGKRTDEE